MTTPSASRVKRVAARFASPADAWLATRIMSWALILPVLKHTMAIQPLVNLAWRRPRFSPDARRNEQVVTFARWACRMTRPRSGGNCLERGLIAYRFLLEGSASPTLVVGMGRGDADELVGHAWVLLDGLPAGESEASVSRYVQMFSFGPDGAMMRSSDPAARPSPRVS